MKEALADVKTFAQRVPSVISAFDSAIESNIPNVFQDLQKRVEEIRKQERNLDIDER